MKSRILTLLLCGASTLVDAQTVFVSKHFNSVEHAQQTLSRQAHFLFDIHGVLFDRGQYVSALKKIRNKGKFIKQGIKAAFSKKARRAYKELQKTGNKITERKFNAVKEFEHLHQELIDFSNNIFSPNNQMRNLLLHLKSRGHQLYLCSNIGNVTLERLVAQHPTFFAIMDSAQNTINRTAAQAHEFVWKPQQKAFDQATDTIGRKAHFCIFVDDQINNVQAAHKAGLTAIHFISYPQFFHDIVTLLKL